MKAELVPLNGDPPIPITRDITVVGRREYCDVCIDHETLSKRHCVLVRTDGLLMVRDLITTNGTKVNGQRIMWAALLPNDRLTLGGYKFKVYLGPDDLPAPSEGFQSEPAGANGSSRSGRGGPRGGTPALAPPVAKPPTLGFAPPTPDPSLQPLAAFPQNEEIIELEDRRLDLRSLAKEDDDLLIELE